MTISGASVDAIVKKVLLAAHPVGSFYVSADPTDPSTLWGGVWQMLPEGTFLMACGDGIPAGSTGGEAEHVLTVEEMPSHGHGLSEIDASFSGSTGSAGSHSHSYTDSRASASTAVANKTGSGTYVTSISNSSSSKTTGSGGSHSHSFSGSVTLSGDTGEKGGGQAHNNLPPYLAVYIWKRTA